MHHIVLANTMPCLCRLAACATREQTTLLKRQNQMQWQSAVGTLAPHNLTLDPKYLTLHTKQVEGCGKSFSLDFNLRYVCLRLPMIVCVGLWL